MITFVNSNNADSYSLLYSDVTKLLQTHTAEGYTKEEAEQLGKEYEPVLTFEAIELTQDQFLGFEGELYSDQTAETLVEITQDNANKLFAESNGEPVTFYQPETINSLNEFFGHLADIAKVEPRYTRLPLDEDFLSINLDTRKIDVPKTLSSIAVQGDEMSEILYFKVKRYYDAADLYGTTEIATDSGSYRRNPMDIYIQWEREASEEEKAAAAEDNKTLLTVKGVSIPYIIDAESEPGYIIFGWPLSTSITKLPGEVKFSVRFYIYNDGQITYSLSTLTNKITVNAGLDYDLEYIKKDNSSDTSFIIDNKAQAIIDRYVNSVVNHDEMEVPVPVFTIGLWNEEDNKDKKNDLGHALADESQVIHIAKAYDEGEDSDFVTTNLSKNPNTLYLSEPIVMYIQARTGGDGSLGYYWKKSDVNGIAEKFNEVPTTVMRKTKDTARNLEKTYYYYADNKTNTSPLIVPSNTNDSTDFDFTFVPVDSETGKGGYTVLKGDGNTIVFEKYGKAVLDSAGYYYAVATNRVHNNVASTRTPGNSKDANGMTIYNYLKIPEPKVPVYLEDKKLGEPVFLRLTDDKKETINDTYKADLVVGHKPTGDDGLVTYTWKYQAAGTDEWVALDVDNKGYVRFDGEEDTGIYHIVGEANYQTIDGNDGGLVTGPKLSDLGYALGDGIYQVTMTNHLNRYSTEWMTDKPDKYSEMQRVMEFNEETGEYYATGEWEKSGRPAVCTATDETCVSQCRVTHLPSEPNVRRVGDQRLSLTEVINKGGLKVEIEALADNPEKYTHEVINGEYHTDDDRYIYKWYRYVTWTSRVTEDDTQLAEEHKYKVEDDKLIVLHEGLELVQDEKLGTIVNMSNEANVSKALDIDDGNTYMPDRAGIYFCQVINIYNGCKSVYQCSPFFVVSDTASGAVIPDTQP